MPEAFDIRPATLQDAANCSRIYAPYVVETAISFELDPPDEQAMRARIAAAIERHAWLVATRDDTVIGYAYGAPFHGRAAYRWACEVSVYLDRGAAGAGIGTALYGELLDALAGRGYVTAIAGLTLPNEASRALHASLGFSEVGTFREVGFKFGAWHDVAYLQRELAPRSAQPSEST